MKSIRRRLFWTQLVASIVLTALVGVLLYARMRTSLQSQYDDTLRTKARSLAAMMTVGSKGFEAEISPEALPEFSRNRMAQYLQVLHGDGTVAFRSKSLGENALPSTVDSDRPEFVNLKLPDGNRGRAILLRFDPVVEIDGAESPPATSRNAHPMILTYARDRDDLDDRLEILLAGLIMAAVVMSGGMVLVSVLTMKAGLQYLWRFADDVDRLDASNLSIRFDSHSVPTELEPISTRLNDLLRRLEEAFNREKRFTANAAHELRTPIAELRTLAEVALRHDSVPEFSRVFFQDTLAISKQMENLVKSLLTLARGQHTTPVDQVNLSDLMLNIWNRAKLHAEAKAIHAESELQPNLTAVTDRVIASSIFSNLIYNAIEYSPREGILKWTLRRRVNAIEFVLENTNESLTAADLPRLSEPFWRKDIVRNSDEHSGLGLSLIKTWSGLANATVTLELVEADRILRVTVSFSMGLFDVKQAF